MSHVRRLVTAAVTAVAAVALSVSTAVAIPSYAPSGVDVSGNNHMSLRGIDWDAVKSDGQSYAFVKATEGVGFVNNHFVRDANAAAAAGLKVGAYHYARPAGDAKQQAASFASQIALVPTQTLPPVLDIEVDEGLSAKQLEEWIDTFMKEVKSLTGRTPMLYTYKYFWMGQMGNTTRFSEYPLWLAAYQDTAPDPVGGWDKLAFWQRSGSGRVAGIETDVDMNLFNGTEAQLHSFSGGNYIDFGGILNDLVIPGVDLGDDAGVLIAGILALAAGAVAVPAVADAAKDAGLDVDPTGLIKQAEKLLNTGAISTDDLKDMSNNDASIGDLAIFLDNAQHLQDVDADNLSQQDVETADRAARSAGHAAGVSIPAIDSKQVADLLNSLR
ncbi:glycoside hydrolase family 25 protein [Corynebacterium aurimucosum]|uniref:glycoside hydrolase family 25 protein n=1 Tax=Corynebacterium aurimucosum TaxID=169292 RepID=UPI00399063FD